MPELLRRLQFVRALPRRPGDAALVAAMSVCGPVEADQIAAELMERDGGRGGPLVAAVVRHWRVLGEPAREAAALCAGPALESMVDGLVRAGDGASLATASAVESWRVLRGETGTATIARLGRLGASASAAIGAPARRAVESLARAWRELGAEQRKVLDAALTAIAAAGLDHGDNAFMAVIAERAAEPGPVLAAWLNAPGDDAHGMVRAAARKVLARSTDGVGLACAWLGLSALARPAAVYLEELFVGGRGDAVVVRVDHLSDERRRGAIRKWCRPERLLPTGEVMGLWSIEARARAAEWLEVVDLREDRRVAALEVVLLDHAAAVRMTAVMALSRMKAAPRVDEALFRAARDEDERVSVAAIGVLGSAQSARRRASIAPVLEELARRGGAGARAAAASVLERFSTEAAAPEVRVRAHLGGVRR